jgi:hypothetical protein
MEQETKACKMVAGEFKWQSSLGRLEENTEVDLREISSDYVN